jgi:hypothetical protein
MNLKLDYMGHVSQIPALGICQPEAFHALPLETSRCFSHLINSIKHDRLSDSSTKTSIEKECLPLAKTDVDASLIIATTYRRSI